MNLAIAGLVFGVIFLSELPDKSQFAVLYLSMRYRGTYVWAGAAAAFLVHVIIAVTAARALSFLPHRLLDVIVAALFAVGAWLLLFHGSDAGEEAGNKEAQLARMANSKNFYKVFATTFGVIFLGEWGDISQIATASYAATYHANLFSVGLGAVLALWAVTAFAILAGAKVLRRIPGRLVQRIAGGLFLIFAAATALQAL